MQDIPIVVPKYGTGAVALEALKVGWGDQELGR
jgi:hypothetical protein